MRAGIQICASLSLTKSDSCCLGSMDVWMRSNRLLRTLSLARSNWGAGSRAQAMRCDVTPKFAIQMWGYAASHCWGIHEPVPSRFIEMPCSYFEVTLDMFYRSEISAIHSLQFLSPSLNNMMDATPWMICGCNDYLQDGINLMLEYLDRTYMVFSDMCTR